MQWTQDRTTFQEIETKQAKTTLNDNWSTLYECCTLSFLTDICNKHNSLYENVVLCDTVQHCVLEKKNEFLVAEENVGPVFRDSRICHDPQHLQAHLLVFGLGHHYFNQPVLYDRFHRMMNALSLARFENVFAQLKQSCILRLYCLIHNFQEIFLSYVLHISFICR